jgi:hypothetical protein
MSASVIGTDQLVSREGGKTAEALTASVELVVLACDDAAIVPLMFSSVPPSKK